jgi:hypothetical protein
MTEQKKELENAKEQAAIQLEQAKANSVESKSLADWWREQREQNGFRALIEDLVRRA